MTIVFFIIGTTLGALGMSILSGNCFEKGYEAGFSEGVSLYGKQSEHRS